MNKHASCFKVVSVSFGSGKQIYSRTEREIELTRFHSVTFEIISGVRDYKQLWFLVTFYIHATSLYCTDEGYCPTSAQGCKHVFWYCIGVHRVLLIIKVSHMPFPSPQEHHLTLKCCISSLKWRAWEGVPVLCGHMALMGRCVPPAYWRSGSMSTLDPTKQSRSSSCKEYVSSSQIQPAFLWFTFFSFENCVKNTV